MSYRELRNFTEIMRSLGYPRLISMENFRKPNFELVADILFWMAKLYDPETTISDRVEFENERVEFLTSIASMLAAKARLKLNTKKLYASDGRAVQELLKLAMLLYKATQSSTQPPKEETVPPPIKVQDVKLARTLASDITQSGAKLYDLLVNEVSDRFDRLQTLRFLDQAGTAFEGSREFNHIERSLKEIIEQVKQNAEDSRKECEELEADEKSMDVKIKKKQEELERTEKRLRSLENVRPQFVEEAEKLEVELQGYYEIYITKHRNLDYLEHELNSYHKADEERRQENENKLKRMRDKLLKEEVELLRGGRDMSGSNTGNNDYGGAASGGGGLFGGGSKPQGFNNGGGFNNNVRNNPGNGATSGFNQNNYNRGSNMQGSLNRPDDDDDEDVDDDDDEDDSDSDGQVSMGSGRRGGNGYRDEDDDEDDDDEDEDLDDDEDDEDEQF